MKDDRSRLPGPCSRATSSSAAARSRRGSPTACGRRAGSRTARCRSSRPARSTRRPTCMILAIYNPTNVAKVVAGVDEELARILRDGVTTAELERAKDGYLQQQEVMRTNDNDARLVAGREPLHRPDHAVPGRPRSQDQGRSPSRRSTPPAQVHRSQAALRRHRGGFQGRK